MEQLHNGFTLEICPGGFPLSTDSIALSGFVRLPAKAQVLDLGSGCGTLGLLLCAKDSGCRVTGVEISEAAHLQALGNAAANGLDGRLTSICADLRQIPGFVSPGSFHVCLSNPPYFSGGPASQTHPQARREDACTLAEIISAARHALRYGGDFYLVHRPERMAEIFSLTSNAGLEPKRLCLLRHRENGPISLILVQCRKGGKAGLLIEEQSLFHADGSTTDYYRCLYHMQED